MNEEPDLKDKPEYGPYLCAAIFCERALEEKDNTLSLIRIVDRVTRTVMSQSPPKKMEPFGYNLSLVIILKTGENHGTTEIEIIPSKPDNSKLSAWQQTINLEQPSYKGGNIVANISIQFDQPGVWWFEVWINRQLRTKIPLEVIYLPQITQQIRVQN